MSSANARHSRYGRLLFVVLAAGAAVATFVPGCGVSGSGADSGQASAKAQVRGSPQAQGGAETGKGGAQLWSENCMRCHQMRSPSEFSSTEWSIIVQHMRLRAKLTGEEARRIAEFLQSAG